MNKGRFLAQIFRKVAPLLAILFLNHSLHAEAKLNMQAEPFLYAIEKDGKSSFLFGSLHAGVPLDSYPPVVFAAFKSASALTFEADRQAFYASFGQELTKRLRLTPGTSLEDLIGKASMSKLVEIFRAHGVIEYYANFYQGQPKPDDLKRYTTTN